MEATVHRCYPPRSGRLVQSAMQIATSTIRKPRVIGASLVLAALVCLIGTANAQPPAHATVTAAAASVEAPSEPVPAADPGDARLRAELEEILRAPELAKAFVGVHVLSLTDGRTLF